jgi:hypothetical protein
MDMLFIETKDSNAGQIHIKNTGGGLLKGRLLSRVSGLSFEPCEWEGNSQTVDYTFDAAAAKMGIGETLDSRFFIVSNGGEKEVPFSAKLTKVAITAPDGSSIANIRDFYEYALAFPAQARRIFVDSEFFVLLMSLGYKYMEVYESLHRDANRERAMDNFFILSGLKKKTTVEIVGDKVIEFSGPPNVSDMLFGSFRVQKSDAGYVDVPLVLPDSAGWLTLSSAKLATGDFDENNIATVNFTVDPTLIKTAFAGGSVTVGEDSVEIVYRRLPNVTFRLNRDAYKYTDRGIIEVVNNTGANMQIGVFCKENYIRFAARSFPVGERGEIPFEIKLSAFMSAQMLFRKLPLMYTSIEINAKIPGQEFKKNLPVTVGEF